MMRWLSYFIPDVPPDKEAGLERALQNQEARVKELRQAKAINQRAGKVLIDAAQDLVHAQNNLRHKLEALEEDHRLD